MIGLLEFYSFTRTIFLIPSLGLISGTVTLIGHLWPAEWPVDRCSLLKSSSGRGWSRWSGTNCCGLRQQETREQQLKGENSTLQEEVLTTGQRCRNRVYPRTKEWEGEPTMGCEKPGVQPKNGKVKKPTMGWVQGRVRMNIRCTMHDADQCIAYTSIHYVSSALQTYQPGIDAGDGGITNYRWCQLITRMTGWPLVGSHL